MTYGINKHIHTIQSPLLIALVTTRKGLKGYSKRCVVFNKPPVAINRTFYSYG